MKVTSRPRSNEKDSLPTVVRDEARCQVRCRGYVGSLRFSKIARTGVDMTLIVVALSPPRSVETPRAAVPTSDKPVGFLCPVLWAQADALPASGGRLIQHLSGKYARRLYAVSNLPTSRRLGAAVLGVFKEGVAMYTAPSPPAPAPGYLLPEGAHALLLEVGDVPTSPRFQ